MIRDPYIILYLFIQLEHKHHFLEHISSRGDKGTDPLRWLEKSNSWPPLVDASC